MWCRDRGWVLLAGLHAVTRSGTGLWASLSVEELISRSEGQKVELEAAVRWNTYKRDTNVWIRFDPYAAEQRIP